MEERTEATLTRDELAGKIRAWPKGLARGHPIRLSLSDASAPLLPFGVARPPMTEAIFRSSPLVFPSGTHERTQNGHT